MHWISFSAYRASRSCQSEMAWRRWSRFRRLPNEGLLKNGRAAVRICAAPLQDDHGHIFRYHFPISGLERSEWRSAECPSLTTTLNQQAHRPENREFEYEKFIL